MSKEIRRASFVAFCVLIGAAAFASPAIAASSATTCPDEQRTDTGGCAPAEAAPQLSDFQRTQLLDKQAAVAAAKSASLGKTVAISGPTPQVIPGGDGSGSDFKMAAVANMTLYKEGQGNDKKYWTCGPAATRNMVSAMWKANNGSYKDYGEHQFELWENTVAPPASNSGTSSAEVRDTLNAHFSSFGGWKTYRPADRDDYLIQVATDTYQYHQPVIVNIDTAPYDFWEGHSFGHFNVDYGWDSTDSNDRYIYVAEEYDRSYLFGTNDYNPFGKHKAHLTNAFQAENVVDFHRMIV